MSEISAIERLLEYLGENGDHLEELTPDASTRAYFRIVGEPITRIACVYPLDEAGINQFNACLDVTKLFLSVGLPVAKILSSDRELAIIIHEDFGDKILRDQILASDEDTREALLDGAIGLIAKVQAATPIAYAQNSIASRLKFDHEKLLWELMFFKQHYFVSLKKRPLPLDLDARLTEEFSALGFELEKFANVLTHRDFHAANLMLFDGQIKIIDHQDARIGSPAYDLVSLLLDRVTSSPKQAWIDSKCHRLFTERGKLGLPQIDAELFSYEFNLQTIQRCLKAIGTFSFQSSKRDKTQYLQYINPMFKIILQACENLNRFPVLQEVIKQELSTV